MWLWCDLLFFLQIAIKAADISNPTRGLSMSKAWSEHIMEEFFRQGLYRVTHLYHCATRFDFPIQEIVKDQ